MKKNGVNVATTTDVSTAVSNHNTANDAHSTLFANKVTKNANITGATHSKITYDSKGLVTGGADLEVSDVPDLSELYLTVDTTIDDLK